MAMIHDITEQVGKHKRRKRIGRGPGSGHGKTSGRGHKGAGSRSGFTGSVRASYEGGQVAFYTRFPKRGFSNYKFRTDYKVINIQTLDARFDDGAEITPATLAAAGLLASVETPVKLLAQGGTTKKFTIRVAAASKAAKAAIEEAGGSVEVGG